MTVAVDDASTGSLHSPVPSMATSLSDALQPTRWRILDALAREPLTSHELSVVVGLSQQLTNYHLQRLLDRGWVSRSNEDGVYVYHAVKQTWIVEVRGEARVYGGVTYHAD